MIPIPSDSARVRRPHSPRSAVAGRPLAAILPWLMLALLIHAVVAGCGGAKPAASNDSSSANGGTPAPTAGTTGGPSTSGAATPAPGGGASAAAPATGAGAPGAPAATAGGALAGADPVLGASVFAQRCQLCHGPKGFGDGPASKALKPPPRNFHDAAYMSSHTDEELLLIIHQGKGGMPAWGKVLTEPEMRSALLHVRSFAKP